MKTSKSFSWFALSIFYMATIVASLPVYAADRVNPEQAIIDALNDKKALLDAQAALLQSEAALSKAQNPAFPDKFGKEGALTIESAERDKFHVTARSAQSFQGVAKKIADIILRDNQVVALLTELDRTAVPIYWGEKISLDRLNSQISELLGPAPMESAQPEAFGTALVGIGAVLSQMAQFTQLFRVDKSLSFTDSLLPDELLLDLVAVELKDKVLYPAGALDAMLTSGAGTFFGRQLEAMLKRRSDVVKHGEKGAAVLAEMDALASRLVAIDSTTKVPMLLTVLRGEVVDQFVAAAEGRVLSVKVAAKGGTSLKTSSIWRSDRLYAAGGVVATYRLTSLTGPAARVLRAGAIVEETGFIQVPLN